MKESVVIKIGGRAFEDSSALERLALEIKELNNYHFIVVHGGGKAISLALAQNNREIIFVNGVRVTPKEDMKTVEDVLSEKVNKNIADSFTRVGVPCRRMAGNKDRIFFVKPLQKNGKKMGYVGVIVKTDVLPVEEVLQAGLIPVISPISSDFQNRSFNVNADAAAAALSSALRCRDLIYFSDVAGIVHNRKIIHRISIQQAKKLIKFGIIRDGMVGKITSIFDALRNGVSKVHITKWQGENTLSDLIKYKKNIGTSIYLE